MTALDSIPAVTSTYKHLVCIVVVMENLLSGGSGFISVAGQEHKQERLKLVSSVNPPKPGSGTPLHHYVAFCSSHIW